MYFSVISLVMVFLARYLKFLPDRFVCGRLCRAVESIMGRRLSIVRCGC